MVLTRRYPPTESEPDRERAAEKTKNIQNQRPMKTSINLKKNVSALALTLALSLPSSFADESSSDLDKAAATQFADHLEIDTQGGREKDAMFVVDSKNEQLISGFVELLPIDSSHFRHRILIPAINFSQGEFMIDHDLPAYLQCHEIDGPRCFPLDLSISPGNSGDTPDYLVLTARDDSGSAPPFIIGIPCTNTGRLDWNGVPIMLNKENPSPHQAIAYDLSLILFGNENEVQECELVDAAAELAGDIYDWAVDKWDGFTGGLASIGYDSEDGSLIVIARTLGGQ